MTGRPVLLVLHAGRAAKPRGERRAAEAASVGATMRALHSIFGRDKVPEPSVALSTRWEGEPFSRGVYSHVAVGASAQDYDTMSEPCWDETLLFAGEVGDPLRPIATHCDPFRPISTHFSHMSDPVFATSQDLIQKQKKKNGPPASARPCARLSLTPHVFLHTCHTTPFFPCISPKSSSLQATCRQHPATVAGAYISGMREGGRVACGALRQAQRMLEREALGKLGAPAPGGGTRATA